VIHSPAALVARALGRGRPAVAVDRHAGGHGSASSLVPEVLQSGLDLGERVDVAGVMLQSKSANTFCRTTYGHLIDHLASIDFAPEVDERKVGFAEKGRDLTKFGCAKSSAADWK
jgi:hypothetical protein